MYHSFLSLAIKTCTDMSRSVLIVPELRVSHYIADLVAWPNRLGGPMHEIKVTVQELWLKM